MHTWTRRLAQPLERWCGLDQRRRREIRLTAADWSFALLPMPISLMFQTQSADGWGLWGAALGAFVQGQSDFYGPVLPVLLYYLLPVVFAAAATVVRRSYPLWLLCIAFVLLLGFANLVVPLVAVYSYAVHSDRPLFPSLWAVLFMVTMAGLYWSAALDIVFVAVMATLSLLVLGLYVQTRRQLVDNLQERARRLEHEQHLLAEQAVGAERTRIAREMHDVVAHRVSLIVLHAGGLEVSTTDQRAVEAAELIRHTGRQALGELRDILGVLREHSAQPPPTRPQPTLDNVAELVAEWQEAGMRIDLEGLSPSAGAIPPTAQHTAFHVAKEGLTNAAKHAAGAWVRLEVSREADLLRMEVTNGPSPDLAVRPPASGFGLAGLQERVAAVGGHLTSGPREDGGWRLCAELSVVRERAARQDTV
jgi:signal transduction histidine kinase